MDRRIPTSKLDLEDQQRIRDGIKTQVSEAIGDSGIAGGGAGGDDGGLTYGGQQAVTSQILAAIQRDYGNNFSGTQDIPLGRPRLPGRCPGARRQRGQRRHGWGRGASSLLGQAVSGGLGLGGGASFGASGSGTADTISAAQQQAGGGISAVPTGATGSSGPANVTKNVTINNSFQSQPADPMTWAKGVGFEAGSAI